MELEKRNECLSLELAQANNTVLELNKKILDTENTFENLNGKIVILKSQFLLRKFYVIFHYK